MSLALAPGPRGRLLLGNLPEFQRDTLGFFSRLQREYGDIVRLRLAHKVAHVLSHPAMAEQALITETDAIVKYTEVKAQLGLSLIVGRGLLSSYGKLWRRQRDFMNPMFRPKSIEAFAASIFSSGERLVARLEEHSRSGTAVDIWHESTRAALETVLTTLFGAQAVRDTDDIIEAMTVVLRHAFLSIRNPLTPPLSWPTRRNRSFRAALRTIDDLVSQLVRDRVNAAQRKTDLLDLLLYGTYPDTADRMSARQLRDEAVTMLCAGHETTGAALTWALVQIARKPAMAAKLRSELKAVVGQGGLQFPHLMQLPYLQAVVQETLRLHGPAAVISRAVIRETSISGYSIPARSMIFICVYNIHRHEQFWREPDAFIPERFLEAKGAQRQHRCAYIPFGAGERFCIGRSFASVELQILLAQIVGAFDVSLINEAPIPSEFAITLRPTVPVYARLASLPPRAASPPAISSHHPV